jgi:hypothetical protein
LTGCWVFEKAHGAHGEHGVRRENWLNGSLVAGCWFLGIKVLRYKGLEINELRVISYELLEGWCSVSQYYYPKYITHCYSKCYIYNQ